MQSRSNYGARTQRIAEGRGRTRRFVGNAATLFSRTTKFDLYFCGLPLARVALPSKQPASWAGPGGNGVGGPVAGPGRQLCQQCQWHLDLVFACRRF